MNLIEQVRTAGVVGAGGGGFPTHVKLEAKAEMVIANGAECEPLLHKDAALLEHQPGAVVAGLRLAMEATGAREGVIGIKAKNVHALEAVRAATDGQPIRVHLLGDYYPAGDEFDLVYEVTGRVVPSAGLPVQVGVVVCNTETLVNVAAAAQGKPVTQKTITLAGAVQTPSTLMVPIGTPLRDCLTAAGGATTDDPVFCVGGVMMGETTDQLDAPVTKTTAGAVVLPRSHPLIQRKLRPPPAQARIGKSACDQCRYCTEYCPRFLLGHAVEPHQVMRSLAFSATGEAIWNQWAALCCACGLCTLYACPEELYPKEACDQAKLALRAAGIKASSPVAPKPHPMREGRRVPIKSLMKRLKIDGYDQPAPLRPARWLPDQVTLPLKQSAGVANDALVRPGEAVAEGQPLGVVPAGALGAPVHAPFAGTVASVTPGAILLRRTA